MRVFSLALILITVDPTLAFAAEKSTASAPSVATNGPITPDNREPLRIINSFKTPEEVMRYYCERDAAGFIWSGMMDAERKAFTLWKEAPSADTFYVAKSYSIRPARIDPKDKNHALVEVRYDVVAIADSHGTAMPSMDADIRVTYELRKTEGSWKISKPDGPDVAPFVQVLKFPFARKALAE